MTFFSTSFNEQLHLVYSIFNYSFVVLYSVHYAGSNSNKNWKLEEKKQSVVKLFYLKLCEWNNFYIFRTNGLQICMDFWIFASFL